MKKVVAFGDSNTRYYFGDLGVCGPLEEAWPARLEGLLRRSGAEVRVENQGHPGEQMDFARAEFAGRVGSADLCVLGFGTNDVKKPEVGLAHYLADLSDVLDQAEGAGVPVIVLGIPWFDAALGGVEAQARLPVWNRSMEGLCRERSAPFVDLYGTFLDDAERWFNERETPKRHLSAAAQVRVAELVLPWAAAMLAGEDVSLRLE